MQYNGKQKCVEWVLHEQKYIKVVVPFALKRILTHFRDRRF